MAMDVLQDVLEATGYLAGGEPAPGVRLGDDARRACRSRDFAPDALWRSESGLSVYFKLAPDAPTGQVEGWRREIWNQGFAPLLWIVSPERVALYNGFGQPRELGDAAAHRLHTFETIVSALDELDAFAGRLAMETGRFWQQADAVNRKTSVDRQLLSQLSVLEGNLVTAELDRGDAQGLIGRSIFTQYLIDRRIVTARHLHSVCGHDALSAILRDRGATARLFAWLQDTFNGDMFPSEASIVPDTEHLGQVADFLDGVDPRSGQGSLFPYQFDVIPVELISSIYEQFAHADRQAAGRRAETDVFYTRLSLVSLVLDEVMDGLTGEETVLDLTCGSGVFLVEALRRLVQLRANGRPPSRALIRSTLHRQIRGVDISDAAVRVAAFSLYLAALELDPDPKPPRALRFEPLIGTTLVAGDAWDVTKTPAGEAALTKHGELRRFEVIVGNPPWSYRGKAATAARRKRGGRENSRSPRGESLDFVRRAMDFASDKARFGLVLNAMPFFSRSGTGSRAARQLIEDLSPVTLVNLSSQSDWLFPNAKAPAVVLFGKHRAARSDTITAVRVPWSPAGTPSHTFEVAPSDILPLPLADWRRNSAFLKGAFCGYRRDLALLDRLTSNNRTLGDRLAALDARLLAGLKFGNRSGDARSLHGLRFLRTHDLTPLSIPDDLSFFTATAAERPRERDTYRAPLLIVKEFLKGNPRPITAVAERDTVFTDAFFGAALPAAHGEIAHLLAAILSSSLAAWFFLMTASTFGLWMRRLMRDDVDLMPIPDFETAGRSNAGRYLADLAQRFQKSSPREADWQTLDDAVFDLYDLDDADRIVARDGLFRASWQWQSGRDASVEAASLTDMRSYAHTFQVAVGAWLSATKRNHLRAEIFDLPERAPLRLVRFVIERGYTVAPPEVVKPEGNLKDVLEHIGQRMDVPVASFLIGQRELRVHDRREVVIIKPNARRHWMGVSALEDADTVIVESFTGRPA